MSVHEQFADDLALYALGSLSGDERSSLEKHLDECPSCRRELEQLRGDMALMALTASGPRPPARSKQRLMDAVAREPRMRVVPPRRAWWAPIPWIAVAAMVLAAAFLWRENSELKQNLASLQSDMSQRQAELQRARDVVSTLTATDAQRVTVVALKTPPQPQGKAIYVRDRSSLIFLATNMPLLPSNRAYELWLIPTVGAPIPAGVFKPDAHGNATVINPPLPAGAVAKLFAITVEPEQGSQAPTTQPIMVGGE
jgi:anti-sigma-K factor RskA